MLEVCQERRNVNRIGEGGGGPEGVSNINIQRTSYIQDWGARLPWFLRLCMCNTDMW